MATTITRTGGDTVIARTGLTDITITSTTDVEITYNEDELWINILVLGADDAPIALEVADITTVNGVNVTGYTIEQLVQYIADNCFGIISEIDGDLTVNGTLQVNKVSPMLQLWNPTTSNGAYSVQVTNTGIFRISNDFAGLLPFIIKANGTINMANIPTSSAGLSSGDIWNDGGTLKIV